MKKPLLHVFRNTPFGRETLLQSAYICQKLNLPLSVYRPEFKSFLLYFGTDILQVDLDSSYLTDPESAPKHIAETLAECQISYKAVKPTGKSASTLPDLPVNFSLMTCPRSMSDDTRKISLGMIGSKVRRIVQTAHIPVFIPAPVFKPWDRISVLYGGSDIAAAALRLGLEIHKRSGFPLRVFSRGERSELEMRLTQQGFSSSQINSLDWHFWAGGNLVDNLYSIPHNSLVLLGAYGRNMIRETLFGSITEKVQSHLPNSMIIVGPKCDWIRS